MTEIIHMHELINMFPLSRHCRLAIKLARLFPVNLRMIMPKVREEISKRDGQMGSYIAADRLHQKLRNLEMILQQK